MREWRVLASNLPEIIFFRVYETRISLLRAAIIRAPGTPYHNGLFFFNIFLLLDYLSRPPQVHYRSFGFWINLNLYESGRVCLSHLNTWFGNKTEKWDRNQSTILQVLLSIQALVLNDKPFFNEPGTGGLRGAKVMEKKATEYSQGVFVLCCKSVLFPLRSPLVNFEALVASHFLERGIAILTACNAYRSGLARVGGKIDVAGGGLKTEVSAQFKVMMMKVYGNLVEAFAKNGALVEQFVEQLAGEKEAKAREAKKKHENRKKARGAIRKKLMAILEKIWVVGTGFKKSSIGNDQVKVVK